MNRGVTEHLNQKHQTAFTCKREIETARWWNLRSRQVGDEERTLEFSRASVEQDGGNEQSLTRYIDGQKNNERLGVREKING